MNIGKAVRVHDEEARQTVVSITSPTGRVVNSSMPTQATPISASPTQTPLPSSRNSTNKNRKMMGRFSMSLLPVALVDQIALDPVVARENQMQQVVSQRDGQDHRADQHQSTAASTAQSCPAPERCH